MPSEKSTDPLETKSTITEPVKNVQSQTVKSSEESCARVTSPGDSVSKVEQPEEPPQPDPIKTVSDTVQVEQKIDKSKKDTEEISKEDKTVAECLRQEAMEVTQPVSPPENTISSQDQQTSPTSVLQVGGTNNTCVELPQLITAELSKTDEKQVVEPVITSPDVQSTVLEIQQKKLPEDSTIGATATSEPIAIQKPEVTRPPSVQEEVKPIVKSEEVTEKDVPKVKKPAKDGKEKKTKKATKEDVAQEAAGEASLGPEASIPAAAPETQIPPPRKCTTGTKKVKGKKPNQ